MADATEPVPTTGRPLKSFVNWLAGNKADDTAKDPRDKTKSLVAARDGFFKLYMESAKGSLERWQAAAQGTRNAAAAIGVIYTAVLGLAFSVDNPLPPRGLLPALFLGTSIVMATAYEAFPTRPKTSRGVFYPKEVDPHEDPLHVTRDYADFYASIVTDRVRRNRYALRVAVLCLGLGVAAIPLGFVSLGANVGTPDLPTWPDPPAGIETQLANTLYEAQVAEVAKQREAAIDADPGESFDDPGVVTAYTFFGIAFLVVLLHGVPGRLRERRRERAERQTAPSPSS